MPRFDYNAPSTLLHHSHSGFINTYSIKREKSATKEAMSILENGSSCRTSPCGVPEGILALAMELRRSRHLAVEGR
uniref:Uncharacterized protein n=1 Tax=Salix viminalis TaxID=40686 RepID=A0A6N2KGC6_SALVM